jgi:hypothetical protein
MRPTRQILVMALFATALCVERPAEAAPALSPASEGIVRQIAQRLSVTLGSAAARFKIQQVRRQGVIHLPPQPAPAGYCPSPLGRFQLSLFDLRLPPPLA